MKKSKQIQKMELKEFIKETIIGINQGISDAKKELNKYILPPSDSRIYDEENTKRVNIYAKSGEINYQTMTDLSFELSITDNSKDGVSGKIGVFMGNVGAGIGGENKSENISFSKIKFTIPIIIYQDLSLEDNIDK
jgi:hypothetical protein